MSVMLLVSAIAGYLPDRRASHVDPIVALHSAVASQKECYGLGVPLHG